MASIRDVAERANVSPSTVSRVLSGNTFVAPETKEAVVEAMRALDYHPNDLARQLFKNRTHMIGFVMPDIAHPFFSMMARYLEIELNVFGYKLMICSTSRHTNSEKEYLDMLQRRVVDGIIMGSHTLEVEEYLRVKEPIVSFDRHISDDIPSVAADHKKGGLLVAQKLLANGCKEVAIFANAKSVEGPFQIRYEVCADTLADAGVKVHTLEIPWNQFDFAEHVAFVRDKLNQYPSVDGVFAADMVALACLKVFEQQRIPVPERVKIVGYDGTFVAQMSSKTLTTVVQPIQQIAHTLVHAVMQRLEHKKQPREQVLDVYLQEGDTTIN